MGKLLREHSYWREEVGETLSRIRHKTFISYHHDDEREVGAFIRRFDQDRDVFITRGLGAGMPGDVVNSTNTEYVMRRIREEFMGDATVTLVLVGKCTWARRYVDWEIQASLRCGQFATPKGLLGIVLPSAGGSPRAPERLERNLQGQFGGEGYANWYWYPQNDNDLANWIEYAFQARATRASLIQNPQERFAYNRQCL